MQTINILGTRNFPRRLITRKLFVIYESCPNNTDALELAKQALSNEKGCFVLIRVPYLFDENNLSISTVRTHISHSLEDYNKSYDTVFVIQGQLTQKIFCCEKKKFNWEELSPQELTAKIQRRIDNFQYY